MNKPVLVLVLSQQCGACQFFKKTQLPNLEKDLSKDSRIKFVKLEFPEMMVPKSGDFHPELRNGFVEFFPTLLLFPGNLWNDPRSKLKGVAKHELRKNPKVDYSKPSVFSWIDETLKRNPLFQKNGKILLTEYGKPMDNGKYAVPTLGTYNRFHSTKADDFL